VDELLEDKYILFTTATDKVTQFFILENVK
jgi:hypothetical protein